MVEGDRLYYQRGQRPREPLIALGANRFARENNPLLQVEFPADGNRATAFTTRPIGDALAESVGALFCLIAQKKECPSTNSGQPDSG